MYQLDLGTLWSLRQWRKLLNLIDQLPSNTKTNQAMANDEDYLRRVIAIHGALPEGPQNPPLSAWSQESSLLAELIDEVRALKTITMKINSDKGKSVPNPEPVLRPKSAYQKISVELKLERHYALRDRLIKKESGAEVQ